MELNGVNINTECASNRSCAALFLFFSINNLEFRTLLNTHFSSERIKYDGYFSSSNLSKLTAKLNRNDFSAVHFCTMLKKPYKKRHNTVFLLI